MKRIYILSCLCILSISLFAQDYDLGGKIGVNYSQSVITNVITSGDISTDDLENETGVGIVFGGFVRATYGKFSIQPELLFSDNKSYVMINDIKIDDVIATKISKVDLPVLFGYKILNAFRIMGGPVFSNIKETETDPLFQMDNITVGYQAGIGFDVNKLTFDVRYEGNLKALQNSFETDNGSVEFDSRKNVFQFTIGYKLFD